MNLKAQRAAALKAAQDVIEAAKKDSRDLTEDEQSTVSAKFAEIEDLDKKIAAAEKSGALMARIEGLGGSIKDADGDDTPARSIGAHFAKELGGRSIKQAARSGWMTSEFKAATDTQAVGTNGGAFGPLVTDVDRSFVLPYQRPLVVADLMGTGTVSGNAITYPVFGALEGATAFTAEGGAKPQMHVANPTWTTDPLGEVAGFFKITDDMAEDVPYVVSEIEGTARYDLLLKEENALLSGNGTAPNLKGILARTGVQTEAAATAVSGADNADAIFRAITKVQTATGFVADGIVINPADYQALRLRRDSNGQYFGGGFFAGQYGNGAIAMQPPLWGLRTVVTAAVTSGTVAIGAWQTAKVFRKGGLRVESTNSNVDDFENDKITIRLRERLGLQVKYPAAFVKVTLDYASS